MSIGSFGDTCLLYMQRGPARPSSSRTEAWGWLVGHPCRLPAAAGTGGYLQETSSSLAALAAVAAVACLATTPLLAPFNASSSASHGSSIYTHYPYVLDDMGLSLFSNPHARARGAPARLAFRVG